MASHVPIVFFFAFFSTLLLSEAYVLTSFNSINGIQYPHYSNAMMCGYTNSTDSVWCFGGTDPTTSLDRVYSFNGTNFKSRNSLTTPLFNTDTITFIGSTAYILGNDLDYIFSYNLLDGSIGSITFPSPLNTFPSIASDGSKKLYVSCVRNDNRLFSYNTASGNWNLSPKNMTGIHYLGAMVYFNEFLYFFGGQHLNYSKIEMINTQDVQSGFIVSSNQDRLVNGYKLFSSVLLEDFNLIYLIGGTEGGVTGETNRVFVYDITLDNLLYTNVTLPVAVSMPGCAYYSSKHTVWCFGGYNNFSHTNVAFASNILTANPTSAPTLVPTVEPTFEPTLIPSTYPTMLPTNQPSNFPSISPSNNPTRAPSTIPSISPTSYPTTTPQNSPTNIPTNIPSEIPTNFPSNSPSTTPSKFPSVSPSVDPTFNPTSTPTLLPSSFPSVNPTFNPVTSVLPTIVPTHSPIGEFVENTTSKKKESDPILVILIVTTVVLSFVLVFAICYYFLFYYEHKNQSENNRKNLDTQIDVRDRVITQPGKAKPHIVDRSESAKNVLFIPGTGTKGGSSSEDNVELQLDENSKSDEKMYNEGSIEENDNNTQTTMTTTAGIDKTKSKKKIFYDNVMEMASKETKGGPNEESDEEIEDENKNEEEHDHNDDNDVVHDLLTSGSDEEYQE